MTTEEEEEIRFCFVCYLSLSSVVKMTQYIRKCCPFFGKYELFSESKMPLNSEVVKHFLHVQQLLCRQSESKVNNLTIAKISEQVGSDIIRVWETASIPTINKKSVVRKVVKLHTSYRNILKKPRNRKSTKSYSDMVDEYRNQHTNTLFDISRCKCNTLQNCNCEKQHKVPVDERMFLIDQRGKREMFIGEIDKVTTTKIQQQFLRNHAAHNQSIPELCSSSSINVSFESSESSNSSLDSSSSAIIEEFKNPKNNNLIASATNNLELPNVAQECDRFGISDRCAAALTSALLVDIGVVTEDRRELVIDRNKIRRVREKMRNDLIAKKWPKKGIQGLYFDGRKTKPEQETLLKDDFIQQILLRNIYRW